MNEALGIPKHRETTGTTDRTNDEDSSNRFSGALVDVLGSLKATIDTINLKDPPSAGDGSKHFARLPEHLKTLLYRLSHVPGTPEPKGMTTEGEEFMSQHTLTNSTSLLKTALRQKYGLSVVVQPASVQALRTGQLMWDDPSTPGNHSVYQYYMQTPGNCKDTATELAWHLTTTKGRGIKGSDIKRAMKLTPRSAKSVFSDAQGSCKILVPPTPTYMVMGAQSTTP